MIYGNFLCSIVGDRKTRFWVPESWNPIDAVTILIGAYVGG